VSKHERTPVPKGYWTIWTTVALDLVGFGIVVPILGRYAERFGASGLTVGFLFASYSLAQLVGAPLLGRLSDRIGRKPVIVISLIGTAIGSFVTGAAGVLWLLFAGRVIDGASGGSLSVAQAAVADIAPEAQRPRLIGLLGAAFGVGFVLGPAIGGLASLGGPHVPFYVAGVLASANAVAAMIRLPETRHPGRRLASPTVVGRASADAVGPIPSGVAIPASALVVGPASADVARPDSSGVVGPAPHGVAIPASSVLRRLAIVGFITIVAFTGFEVTFSLLGHRRFGLGERGSAFVFLGVGLVLVAVQGGAYARLVHRFGTQRLFVCGVASLVVGLAVTAVAEQWWVLIVALLLLSVGQGIASPSITSLVTQHAPAERRGEALGFQQSAYAVGRVLGPPAAGALFDRATWSPYAAGSLLCAVAVILVLTWGLHRRMPAFVA
jgi:MFS transporter, DHA1 family, tetracycline resistance protein